MPSTWNPCRRRTCGACPSAPRTACSTPTASQRVSHVAGLLSDDRLHGLVRAAVTASLWTEVLDLVIHLDRRLLKRLAALPEVDDPAVLDPLVRAAVAEGVSEELLPLVELLPEPGRARVVAALPAR